MPAGLDRARCRPVGARQPLARAGGGVPDFPQLRGAVDGLVLAAERVTVRGRRQGPPAVQERRHLAVGAPGGSSKRAAPGVLSSVRRAGIARPRSPAAHWRARGGDPPPVSRFPCVSGRGPACRVTPLASRRWCVLPCSASLPRDTKARGWPARHASVRSVEPQHGTARPARPHAVQVSRRLSRRGTGRIMEVRTVAPFTKSSFSSVLDIRLPVDAGVDCGLRKRNSGSCSSKFCAPRSS